LYGFAYLFEKFLFDPRIIEESSSRSCVANSDALPDDTETPSSGIFISADDYDGARTHMLFLAHHARNAFAAEVGKGQ
jgi:hypothetical protein